MLLPSDGEAGQASVIVRAIKTFLTGGGFNGLAAAMEKGITYEAISYNM